MDRHRDTSWTTASFSEGTCRKEKVKVILKKKNHISFICFCRWTSEAACGVAVFFVVVFFGCVSDYLKVPCGKMIRWWHDNLIRKMLFVTSTVSSWWNWPTSIQRNALGPSVSCKWSPGIVGVSAFKCWHRASADFFPLMCFYLNSDELAFSAKSINLAWLIRSNDPGA